MRKVKGEGRGGNARGEHCTNDLVFHPCKRKMENTRNKKYEIMKR